MGRAVHCVAVLTLDWDLGRRKRGSSSTNGSETRVSRNDLDRVSKHLANILRIGFKEKECLRSEFLSISETQVEAVLFNESTGRPSVLTESFFEFFQFKCFVT